MTIAIWLALCALVTTQMPWTRQEARFVGALFLLIASAIQVAFHG